MNAVVTCGPGSEPIDEVRRITNFSSGELGVRLANRLAAAGHDVTCLKGSGATTPIPLVAAATLSFTTNDDLLGKLAALPRPGTVDAVFHAAALGDFTVASIRDTAGRELRAAKIPSRQDAIALTLVPARKVLPELRGLFPSARIVGWKYELEGSRPDAVAAAVRQFREATVDACVVNGKAWGDGFGFVVGETVEAAIPTKEALAEFLADWLVHR